MIKFRQKIFLSPATRIGIKMRRLIRPTNTGLKRATRKSLDNVKDIKGTVDSSVSAVKNVSTSALVRLGHSAPPNYRAAQLMNNTGNVAATYENLAKNNIAKAGEHVGKIVDRTPSALVGPAIPVPGATEALGIVGPFVEELTPVGEIIKPIAKGIKKGVKYIRKN